ncbi:Conserved hypothetical protein, gene in Ubiquinol-cytochrome C chaperone locus [hydrothermal vent metagenome]|uniref:COG1399 protein, clustered with ribosomal protein L32p n=1 Tax=hydrothermal vent metagenome TaxID=652676 RepID=A0A3B0S4L1_9ZZZZ
MKNQQIEAAENSFSRPVNVDKVKSRGQRENIAASQQECEKLAGQLSINKVEALSFRCLLMPWKKGGVEVTGQVTATIKETCVVTLEPFSTEISQEVKRYFERASRQKSDIPLLDLENIEDEMPDIFDNGIVDIGEVAVETLALCLSPYPRKPGVVFADHLESNPESDDDQAKENPFDVLQQLKKH